MKELTNTIKDGKDKSCPLCKSPVVCSSFYKKERQFLGREFWSTKCRFKYIYVKYRASFRLTHVDYKITGFEVSSSYEHPIKEYNYRFKGTRILPHYYDEWSLMVRQYGDEIKIPEPLEFPITLENLENKVTLLQTFS